MYLSDLAKILSVAAILNRVPKGESRKSLVALAWSLRNRGEFRRESSKSLRSGCRRFCYEVISGAGRSVSVRSWNVFAFLKLGLDEGYYSSLAIACLVWCGEEADPTAGATHFHRHDDWPEWAKHSEPVALIGSWFFYNEKGGPLV